MILISVILRAGCNGIESNVVNCRMRRDKNENEDENKNTK